MTRTVVVGLDGANYELLEPWIEAGDLPTLARIVNQGVTGDLRSVLPPVTSPNWKAYATGKNPGKLGVFWWQNVDVKNRRVHRPTERYHDNVEYWELLAERERVGVVNVPTTYPPKSTGEFLIAGPPDGRNRGYTHPPELESELRNGFGYRVTKQRVAKDGDDEAYEEVLDLIDLRFAVAKYLMERHDLSFLQVTTFYINLLHHHLWDAPYTKRGWEIIDRHLASFLDDGYNLVLMSDHGHAEIETVFNVNVWLEQNGYLTYDAEVAETLHSVGITADRLKRLVSGMNQRLPGVELQDLVEQLTPQWVLNRLPDEKGELGGSKHEILDWDRSKAIGSAQGPIYLTVDPDSHEYEPLREALIAELSTLTGPDGRPIANAVYRSEDVYEGPYLDEAPDIVVDKAKHVNIREGFGSDHVFPDEDPSWSGVNKREGLFAAVGPAFGTGTIDGLSILDLAPTLLHLHGCAVPDDMDGEVRHSVFADGTEPATSEVRRRSVAD